MITIALIGDSDISRWPSELYPSLILNNININTADEVKELQQQLMGIDDEAPPASAAPAPSSGVARIIVSGQSGATLQEVIPHVQETIAKHLLVSENDESMNSNEEAAATRSHKARRRLENTKNRAPPKQNSDSVNERSRNSSGRDDDDEDDDDDDNSESLLVLVICAGENDIGNGISLTDSTQSLDEILSSITLNHNGNNNDDDDSRVQVGVIFLGPKLEPWVKHDVSARKEYIRMSRSFEACFQRHCDDLARQHQGTTTTKRPPRSIYSLAYVDCLTMFCGDNAERVPGALMGGRAEALDVYFDPDQLHLSNEGYKIWKQVVENSIHDMMATCFKQTSSIRNNNCGRGGVAYLKTREVITL